MKLPAIFLISLGVLGVLSASLSISPAAIIASESFNYSTGILAGDVGGSGFGGSWTSDLNPTHGTFAVQATGLSMNGVASSGGSVLYSGDTNTSGGSSIFRELASPLTGIYYGSYLFTTTASTVSSSQPVGGVGTGSLTQTDNTAPFFWAGDGFNIKNPAVRAGGSSWPSSNNNNLVAGTTYLFLFMTDTASNTTSGWVLTESQYLNFSASLSATTLNAATVGAGSSNVYAKMTATAGGTAGAQTGLFLEGYNAGNTGYNFTYDELRVSNSSLSEAVTAVPEPTTAGLAGLALGVLGILVRRRAVRADRR